MTIRFLDHIKNTLDDIEADGLLKRERSITSPQGGSIMVDDGGRVPVRMINLCAKEAMDSHGFGMASVRFICGAQDIHRTLETKLANYLGKDDAILFAACFDANGGLFEPLLGPDDAIISDSLNHASIIDGIRLCKAKRYRYANSDMADLEAQLQQAQRDGARFIMIATDGVFSMDGYLAKLPEIVALGEKYNALVVVDDCHATGFMGPNGSGTPSHFGVDVDILTGTLGKALGGALGGYIAGPQAVIDLLRQRARPYLFSNSLPPSIVAAGIKALEIVEAGDALRSKLFENARYWRDGLTKLGFTVQPGEHPIIPVMLGDAKHAQSMAEHLNKNGVYVAGFFYPVVPKGQARIRTQMSSTLTRDDLDFALDAFEQAGRATGALT